jgi:hypothetical protein
MNQNVHFSGFLKGNGRLHGIVDWKHYSRIKLFIDWEYIQNSQIYFIPIVNQTDAPVSQIYLFWINTLNVLDGLSIHHREFKTVHTATGICQTDTATCLLAGTRWNSWRWTERSSETCGVSLENKEIWGTGASSWFTIEICYDARTCERQTYFTP